jgi:amino acid transporter
MYDKFKKFIIGRPLRTEEIEEEKLNVPFGLAILSSDAISSVAYATEEILWVLVPVIGILSYQYMFYAALAIILLLSILVFSYRQTINSYPNGGGAYIVAKDNLGTIPGLIAGASLSVDYILTVAVSSSAGTAAITSAIPELLKHRVSITLLLILIISIGNLRGVRESAKIFSFPPYLFILTMLAMIIYGIYKVKVLGYVPQPAHGLPSALTDITIFLFLRAFAAGCTALTGVEAVSNGIPNFKEPSQKNAITVLFLLAFIIICIFGGTSYLATLYHAVPSLDKTVVSQIASQVFGNGLMFYLVQVMTAIILILAANTAFSGLPLLLAVMAKDGYAPRQFTKRGQRLGFSNGIILLSITASILIILFSGETHHLIPLYAVGVFISFTLSQFGMFLRWIKKKERGWIIKAFINGLGSLVTFITVLIIGFTKFAAGAWIVLVLLPVLVYSMLKIKNHYIKTAKQLGFKSEEVPDVVANCERVQHFIVLIESMNKSVIKTMSYAKCLSKDIVAFHISVDKEATEKLIQRWEEYNCGVPLIVRESPYRNIIQPLIEYIESEEHSSKPGDIITVVMPQFIVSKWWEAALHNQTAIFIRNSLLKHRNIAVVTVPYLIEEDDYLELIKKE